MLKRVCLFLLLISFSFSHEIEDENPKKEVRRERKGYMNFMEIENKIAFGLDGEYDYNGEKNESEQNLSVSSETLYKIDSKVKFGIGAKAVFRGRMKTDSGRVFVYDSLPLYLTYRFFPREKAKKYKTFVKINYGISFNQSDSFSRGQYYSGGIGMEVLDTWIYDLMYEVAEGEYEDQDCSQSMISLGIGYKIRF